MTTRRAFLAVSGTALYAAAPRSQMGLATTCYMTVRRFRDTLEFLEHANSLGAGGIQSQLTTQTPEYLKQVRSRAEKYGMWIEVMAGLPRTDNDEAFAKTLDAAKQVGALCVRSACLGGRRYETFRTMDDWTNFVNNSHAAIQRGVAMAEKARIPWALENHKDWTADEFLAILKRYSSAYLGVCLDTGNNMALLDQPMDLVEKLLPYAVSTHLKDMGVDEYADGFLLSEVRLGEGMLDIPKIVGMIRSAKPKVKITLEMITRDPLKVPCLTDKYWATFPNGGGQRLATMLRTVRTNRKKLPMLTTLEPNAQKQAEEDNVIACLEYARTKINL